MAISSVIPVRLLQLLRTGGRGGERRGYRCTAGDAKWREGKVLKEREEVGGMNTRVRIWV